VVHNLPATVPVSKVLQHFEKKKLQAVGKESAAAAAAAAVVGVPGVVTAMTTTPQQIRDFCQGMLRLFEDALPVCLLYPQERPQYEQLLVASHDQQQKPLADVYGCEYLLRLFVRLPVLLQAQKVAAKGDNNNDVQYIGPLLTELLVLLQKNRQACFKGSYREPTPAEWLEWEQRIHGGDCSNASSVGRVNAGARQDGPATPVVERMDTR
jgi:hypothetical protein